MFKASNFTLTQWQFRISLPFFPTYIFLKFSLLFKFLKENETNNEIKPSIQMWINDEKQKGNHTNTAKPIKWHSLTQTRALAGTHTRTHVKQHYKLLNKHVLVKENVTKTSINANVS